MHTQTKLTLGALPDMSSEAVPANEPVVIHTYSQLYMHGIWYEYISG